MEDKIKPIPLTEEWFRDNNIQKSFYFAEVFTVEFRDGIVWIEEYCEGEFQLKHIKYIHQWQNLYFDLRGEELIIN